MWLAIFSLLTAFSTFSQLEQTRKNNEYQAQVQRRNAEIKRQEAELTKRKAEAARQAAEEEQKKLKRDFRAAAGTNKNLLASANLDITYGSALGLLEGNINTFADDMGQLKLDAAMEQWNFNREAQLLNYEADVADENASYLDKTAGSLGSSILGAGLSGLGSYASGSLMSGNSLFSTSSVIPEGAFNPSTLAR